MTDGKVMILGEEYVLASTKLAQGSVAYLLTSNEDKTGGLCKLASWQRAETSASRKSCVNTLRHGKYGQEHEGANAGSKNIT